MSIAANETQAPERRIGSDEHLITLTEAAKHVLVEKPMARTVQEADAMIDAAKKARASVSPERAQ